jgi:hypothetical protein
VSQFGQMPDRRAHVADVVGDEARHIRHRAIEQDGRALSGRHADCRVRKAGDEHERSPGFVEADLVAHCGPTLVGEFVRTLTVTDVFTGWTENIAIRNSAHRWVIEAMTQIERRLPFPLVGLDTDNGGEFINHALIGWAGDLVIYFTRARPYKSNDNVHVEQKNGDVVRRHAFHYRYDTVTELRLLNELYELVRFRLNLFTATKKAVGWLQNKHGKNTRVYDTQKTPFQRVIESGVLDGQHASALTEVLRAHHSPDPADRRPRCRGGDVAEDRRADWGLDCDGAG